MFTSFDQMVDKHTIVTPHYYVFNRVQFPGDHGWGQVYTCFAVIYV